MFRERSEFLYSSIGFVLGASYGFLKYQDLSMKISEGMAATATTLANFCGGMLSAVALGCLLELEYGNVPAPGGGVFTGSIALGASSYYLDKSYNIVDSIMPTRLQNMLDYFESDHTLFAVTSTLLAGSASLICLEHQMSAYIILP